MVQGTESTLLRWSFLFIWLLSLYYQRESIDTHIVRHTGTQSSCLQQYLAQTKLGTWRLWKLCIPDFSFFCVPSPQDCSVPVEVRWLIYDSLSSGNHVRCLHCRLYRSPPVYLSTPHNLAFPPNCLSQMLLPSSPKSPTWSGPVALFQLVPFLTSSHLKHSLLFASCLKNYPVLIFFQAPRKLILCLFVDSFSFLTLNIVLLQGLVVLFFFYNLSLDTLIFYSGIYCILFAGTFRSAHTSTKPRSRWPPTAVLHIPWTLQKHLTLNSPLLPIAISL